jgi:hypothetical protein
MRDPGLACRIEHFIKPVAEVSGDSPTKRLHPVGNRAATAELHVDDFDIGSECVYHLYTLRLILHAVCVWFVIRRSATRHSPLRKYASQQIAAVNISRPAQSVRELFI